ncbi:hypothetical protein [Leptospira kanakyensis]|uniref:hypothetical protein n=1 Tax=Leptospira kanakyensis TaxID=2484968 RepID=UPI00223D145D|nr:hypothetical protein [Leptospira kanakyensis]MCW7471793.1 hypothetical protein [Leptospira kanakyensis]MCW7483327.1 hypothetical protein [Leptospira kanakyensis]
MPKIIQKFIFNRKLKLDKIKTLSDLANSLEIKEEFSREYMMAEIFYEAMVDWPKYNLYLIKDFINELHDNFGIPLTFETIRLKTKHSISSSNFSKVNSASSIVELFDISWKFDNNADFLKILNNIFDYLNEKNR